MRAPAAVPARAVHVLVNDWPPPRARPVTRRRCRASGPTTTHHARGISPRRAGPLAGCSYSVGTSFPCSGPPLRAPGPMARVGRNAPIAMPRSGTSLVVSRERGPTDDASRWRGSHRVVPDRWPGARTASGRRSRARDRGCARHVRARPVASGAADQAERAVAPCARTADVSRAVASEASGGDAQEVSRHRPSDDGSSSRGSSRRYTRAGSYTGPRSEAERAWGRALGLRRFQRPPWRPMSAEDLWSRARARYVVEAGGRPAPGYHRQGRSGPTPAPDPGFPWLLNYLILPDDLPASRPGLDERRAISKVRDSESVFSAEPMSCTP